MAERTSGLVKNLEVPVIDGTGPISDEYGRILFPHAPEVPFDFSKQMWEKRNGRMQEMGIDRQNSEIVVVNPREDNVTLPLIKSLQERQIGNHPVAYSRITNYEDGERDIQLVNEPFESKPDHVYLVGSISSADDYLITIDIADQIRNTLGIRNITLLTTHLWCGRQDKNVSPKESYNAKTINIRAIIQSLSKNIDTIIVDEPHSFATQYFAAQCDVPLAPVSPWEDITKALIAEAFPEYCLNGRVEIDPDKFLIAGPDIGRNIAATRIARKLGIPLISGNKIRVNETQTEIKFPDEQKRLINGRYAISYDDEVSSFGTGESLMHKLQESGALGFAMAGIHGKLTNQWDRIMTNPFLIKLLITDSRVPTASRERVQRQIDKGKLVVYSLVDHVRKIIQADINEVNFWEDPQYSPMILQRQ